MRTRFAHSQARFQTTPGSFRPPGAVCISAPGRTSARRDECHFSAIRRPARTGACQRPPSGNDTGRRLRERPAWPASQMISVPFVSSAPVLRRESRHFLQPNRSSFWGNRAESFPPASCSRVRFPVERSYLGCRFHPRPRSGDASGFAPRTVRLPAVVSGFGRLLPTALVRARRPRAAGAWPSPDFWSPRLGGRPDAPISQDSWSVPGPGESPLGSGSRPQAGKPGSPCTRALAQGRSVQTGGAGRAPAFCLAVGRPPQLRGAAPGPPSSLRSEAPCARPLCTSSDLCRLEAPN